MVKVGKTILKWEMAKKGLQLLLIPFFPNSNLAERRRGAKTEETEELTIMVRRSKDHEEREGALFDGLHPTNEREM